MQVTLTSPITTNGVDTTPVSFSWNQDTTTGVTISGIVSPNTVYADATHTQFGRVPDFMFIEAKIFVTLYEDGTAVSTWTYTSGNTNSLQTSISCGITQSFILDNITLNNGSNYTIHTGVSSGYVLAYHTNYGFTAELTAEWYVPKVESNSVGFVFAGSTTDAFTEITRGGFQVIAGTSNFIKVKTDASGTIFGSVPQLEVGGLTELNGDLYVKGTNGEIRADGNITAYYGTTSDKRLKDNIQKLQNPLDKILKIGGYTFDWNENQKTYEVGETDYGVVAQEVQEIFPDIVKTQNSGYLGVRYDKFIPILIESIKELNEKVEMLEDKLKRLDK